MIVMIKSIKVIKTINVIKKIYVFLFWHIHYIYQLRAKQKIVGNERKSEKHCFHTLGCRREYGQNIFLLSDYVPGGEMFTHLFHYERFSEAAVRIYIGEIILALERLHDVRINNILIII